MDENVTIKIKSCRDTLPYLYSKLDELISQAVPSEQGLYPHEILMLSLARNYTDTTEKFEDFWQFQYYVSDPRSVIESLLERGFLRIRDLQDELSLKYGKYLKQELSNLNIPEKEFPNSISSRVQLLLEKGNIDELRLKYPCHYECTDLGRKEVTNNPYVYYLHHKPVISIWKMNHLINRENPEHLSFEKILEKVFIDKSLEARLSSDLSSFNKHTTNLFNLVVNEFNQKQPLNIMINIAICQLAGYTTYDLSLFVLRHRELAFRKKLIKDSFPYSSSKARISQETIKRIKGLMLLFDCSFSQLRIIFYKECSNLSLPYQFFTILQQYKILYYELTGERDKVEEVYFEAYKAQIDKYNEICKENYPDSYEDRLLEY